MTGWVLGELDDLVGVHHPERDRGVLVHQRGGGLEADRGAAGADLDPDAGALAARDQRAGDPLVARIDPVAGADELVDAAVLGLGEPAGLHHHRVRADPLEADASPGRG
jgi:hypothetical protein